MARLTRGRPLETFAPKNQLPNVLVRMFEVSIVDGKTHCALIAAHDDYVKQEKRDEGYIKNYEYNLK